MPGMNSLTGREIEGWDHCFQRIADRLNTLRGTRVMRHKYGSLVPRVIDRPQTQDLLLELTLSIISCLHDPVEGEPCFRVGRIKINDMQVDGLLQVDIYGVYFPRGHLGDYSVYESRRGELLLTEAV